MIMQRRTLSITAAFFLLFLYHSATAQTADSLTAQSSSGPAVVYSLQQCVDSAVKNNATVKLAEFTARTARVQYLQQIGYAFPSLYGTADYLNNGGKSINNYTNTYVTENYNQGVAQLYGSLVLWNGGSIQNYIRQYSLAYEANKKDWQYQKDLITIQVILAYLSVLSSEEQLALAQAQAADIRHRVDLMVIQDSLGSIAPSALSDQKGQLNAQEVIIVNTKNTLETNKLALAQAMNVPYSPNMDLVKVNVDPTPVIYNATVDQIYQNATKNIAAVAAAELHMESAIKGVKANRGNMFPTLSLQYYLTTNYSTAASTNQLLSTSNVQTSSYVNVNGSQVYVYSPEGTYSTPTIPFNTQFKNNVYTQAGLYLNIPILNRWNYRTLYRQSKVTLDQARFNQKTTITQLRQAVESNYVQMMQAFRLYNVQYHQVTNYEESFREAKIKYDAGALASLDFVIYNTNKNQAELNLIAAKYSYLLQTKILDYYQGQLTW